MFLFIFLALLIAITILFAWARRAIRARVMGMSGQPGGPQFQVPGQPPIQRMDPASEILAGTIAGVESAGLDAYGQALWSIDLDVYQTDGTQLRRTVRSATARVLGSGDPCVVAVDIHDSELVYFSDNPLVQGGQSVIRLRMLEALPAQFSGKLAVGDIVVDSNTNSDGGLGNVQVSVVHIGHPPQLIWCKKELLFAVGDRVFVKLDALSPPRAGVILSLKFTAGQKIKNTGNRMDGIVLSEDLLASGARAQGTILSAQQEALPAALIQAGISKWILQVSVAPENGTTPYVATIPQGLTAAYRSEQITQAGAIVPIRFDPYDPQTCRLDTVTMGWRQLIGEPHPEKVAAPPTPTQVPLRETLLQEAQPAKEASPEDSWKELRKWT